MSLERGSSSSSSSSIYFTNDLKHNCFYVDISIEIIVVTLGMYVIWGCIVLTADLRFINPPKHPSLVTKMTFFIICFFLISAKNSLKMFEITKKVEHGPKKYFNQLLGAHSTQKLVEIHNNPNSNTL